MKRPVHSVVVLEIIIVPFLLHYLESNWQHIPEGFHIASVLQGQAYHTTTTLHPSNDQPTCGQLCIIDADEALQHRMDAPQNSLCSPVTMRKISDINHQIKPYAELYKNMHGVEQEGKARAMRDSVLIRRGSDIRCYNYPTIYEIAAVFVREKRHFAYPRDAPPAKISYTCTLCAPYEVPYSVSPWGIWMPL